MFKYSTFFFYSNLSHLSDELILEDIRFRPILLEIMRHLSDGLHIGYDDALSY